MQLLMINEIEGKTPRAKQKVSSFEKLVTLKCFSACVATEETTHVFIIDEYLALSNYRGNREENPENGCFWNYRTNGSKRSLLGVYGIIEQKVENSHS